jgi:hypothetical protein
MIMIMRSYTVSVGAKAIHRQLTVKAQQIQRPRRPRADQPRPLPWLDTSYCQLGGLEPLTPCLQSDGVDFAKPRSGALSVGEPSLYSAEQREHCCTLLLYWFAPSEVPTWARVHPWPWIEDAPSRRKGDCPATACVTGSASGFVGSRGGGARCSVPCPAAFQRRGGCCAESFGSTATVLRARHFRPALGLKEKESTRTS